MTESQNPTPAESDDVEGHRFLAGGLSHEEAPPADSDDDAQGHMFKPAAQDEPASADSDDDVSGHRFVASGIRATGDDAEDDDVSGHGFPQGATDPKFIGSDEVDAPGLTGALKEKDQL